MHIPGNVELNHLDEGAPGGAPVVFLHALGTDLNLWDSVLPRLPAGLRLVRMDLRGHGRSPCPAGAYFMGDLVADVAAVLDRLRIRDAVVVGMSMGGMVAQGLAAERPDLVRALVLSNTAAKVGTADIWRERIGQVRENGVEAIADATLAGWFPPSFRNDAAFAARRDRLLSTPVEAVLGWFSAIAETDLLESTSRLRMPSLVIAGSEDGATPSDLVRETAGLIPGSRFHLIRGAGHLPCVDRPDEFAAVVGSFLRDIVHA